MVCLDFVHTTTMAPGSTKTMFLLARDCIVFFCDVALLVHYVGSILAHIKPYSCEVMKRKGKGIHGLEDFCYRWEGVS